MELISPALNGDPEGFEMLTTLPQLYDHGLAVEGDLVSSNQFFAFAGFHNAVQQDVAFSNGVLCLAARAGEACEFEELGQLDGLMVDHDCADVGGLARGHSSNY